MREINSLSFFRLLIISALFILLLLPVSSHAKSWEFSCGPELKQQWKLTIREKGKNVEQIEITDVIPHGKNYIVSLNVYSDQQDHGEHYWMSTETYMVSHEGKILWSYVHKEHGIENPLLVYGGHSSGQGLLVSGDRIYRAYHAKSILSIGSSRRLFTSYLSILDMNGKPISLEKLKGVREIGMNIFYDNKNNGIPYTMGCYQGKCNFAISNRKKYSWTGKQFARIYSFKKIDNTNNYNRTFLLGPKTILHPYDSGIVGENVLTKAVDKIKGLFSSGKSKRKRKNEWYIKYKLVELDNNGKVLWSKKLPFEAYSLYLVKHKQGFSGYYISADSVSRVGPNRRLVKEIVHIELDKKGGLLDKKIINLPDGASFYGSGGFGDRIFYGYRVSRAYINRKTNYLVIVKEKELRVLKLATGLNVRINLGNYLFFGSNNLYLCR
ncbi:MAG: hypothetical protein BMS9Abin11_0338 [Gammaproteobacteria bacterium]|nr:MAG: hypothetical protein BMS9Abin11_0338 [Gammaproteobacteria bacterium]